MCFYKSKSFAESAVYKKNGERGFGRNHNGGKLCVFSKTPSAVDVVVA